eukprot:CAMPEP_0119315700 /NCGR_PEP_ID=MMETSP1333-20130426/36841_1 /TAXON_ID=418940 /ORGANISM="Scyphosphaera apsteinii, Strain RCC1455" /LENGTH=171 /DNA_ID=CAMNT_0007321145 /DNA_START=1 /DNA_END=516 /DNA_ORIENTATION=-
MAVKRLAALLSARGQTIAVAETSAGGAIASKLLGISGASSFFCGGVICYTADSKKVLLQLDCEKSAPTATERHAIELASAIRSRLKSDWGIGESGVAGPSKNSRGVTPGVCAVAVVGPEGFQRAQMLWPDSALSAADAYGQPPTVERTDAMASFSDAALRLAVDVLEQCKQ